MLIEKIINNNIVSAVDSKGREVVVMGRGLGFGMKPGRQIQENKIEKVFRIKSQTLEEKLRIRLPEDEAGFIALHFLNAEYGTDIRDAVKFPNLVKKILEIVEEKLQIELDETSLHYERFVTHIKFLLQRVYRKELLPDEESELAELMQKKYQKEYDCSKMVAAYIEEETKCSLSGEEIMYLAIHIRRVTTAEE